MLQYVASYFHGIFKHWTVQYMLLSRAPQQEDNVLILKIGDKKTHTEGSLKLTCGTQWSSGLRRLSDTLSGV